MTPRLLYLLFCQVLRWLALLAHSSAFKDAELLMLRREVAMLRRQVARPRIDWADRTVLAGLVLRHQLTVLRRQTSRPKFQPADRALLEEVSRMLPRARWSCFFVKPETLLRWHRRPVAGAWTYPHRGRGRPPPDEDVQQLIVRLASENPRRGDQRIQGELRHLDIGVSATAIRTTLRRNGLARRHGARPPRGGRSLPSRPPGSSRATSSPSTPCGCAGCMCCSSSNPTPAESTWPG
jgi:putative transposase